MKIGEIAGATGVAVDTIRHYEREGLLPAPARSAANYRRYGAAERERLGFIRNCRALDMSLDEIRALLRFRDAPTGDCEGVNALLDEHIGHVAQRLEQLIALDRQLRRLRAQCRKAAAASDCGILAVLEHAPAAAAARAPARKGHARGTHG
jgi:Cd(II)/Pb(II)-responsive transcriptional regulator